MGVCFWQPNKSKVQQAPWDRDELNDTKVQFHNLHLFLTFLPIPVLYLEGEYSTHENIHVLSLD
jgi:hypothetical protein